MSNQKNWGDICTFLGIHQEFKTLVDMVAKKQTSTNLDFYRPLFNKIVEKLGNIIANANISFIITDQKQCITINKTQFSTLKELIAIINHIKEAS